MRGRGEFLVAVEEVAVEEVGPRPMQVQARMEVSEQGEVVPGAVTGPVGRQVRGDRLGSAEEREAGRVRGAGEARHWAERFLSGKGERCGSSEARSAGAV